MAVNGKLLLRNYRCFNWDNPATLEFGEGFTAFVGANNSGKSTALRSIYELREFFPQVYSIFVHANNYRAQVRAFGIADVAELANDSDPSRFQIELSLDDSFRPSDDSCMVVTKVELEYDVRTQTLLPVSFTAILTDGRPYFFKEEQFKQLQNYPSNNRIQFANANIVDFSAIIDFASSLSQSKYFPAFRNAINEGAGNYYDLPVGTALVATWDLWKAGISRETKKAISRVEKEIADLLGFESLQINADQSSKTLDVNIDGRPQKLHEVGAGVAQLIIVFAAALISKPPYILIDEPELSLHPSLQLNFLTTLGSYAKHGVLYSTHSISLARSSAQQIYAVKKIKNGSSQMHPYSDKAINFGAWLGELSYSSRVELGCEGLLLVEGSTEVLCFQEFLRKIGKDHQYVLMQLGGSSLIRGGVIPQLSELSRIIEPTKIRVVIDSEKSSAEELLADDRVEFVSDCESIGMQVHVLERRATENYFEQNGIRKALGEGYQPLDPFQKIKAAPKPWNKSENWRIARETSFDDIKDTDLGEFLAGL